MKTIYVAIVLAALVPACGGKKSKPLGDKKTACDNIYKQYLSHQDQKVWTDACMAAPDENVRCVNLIMEEGKDSACKKLVNSPERTQLVLVLNGKPEAPAPTASPDALPAPKASPAPEASPAPAAAPPPGGKVAVIRGGNDKGLFDGDKALYIKAGDDRVVAVPKDCEKFTCEVMGAKGLDSDKLAKVCPDASYLEIKIDRGDPPAEPATGPVKLRIYQGSAMSGGDLTGDYVPGGELTEVAEDHVNGKIELKDGDSQAHGTFTAKVCK